MTQEDKSLLLKDLCARLPYNVIVNCTEEDDEETNFNCFLAPDMIKDIKSETAYWIIKPYLRPMSSMTPEEMKTYRTLQDTACSYHYEFGDIVDDFLYFDNDISLDYLNSIHIDYRGLIPMGLALEAKERMYE